MVYNLHQLEVAGHELYKEIERPYLTSYTTQVWTLVAEASDWLMMTGWSIDFLYEKQFKAPFELYQVFWITHEREVNISEARAKIKKTIPEQGNKAM